MCAWRTGYWVAAGHLHRLYDRPEPAATGAEPRSYAVAFRRRVDGSAAAGPDAGLCHHDSGLALGGAGADQPAPRPSCILRVQLFGPYRPRRPGLRNGGRAAALYTDLRHDPRAAADAVRRGADHGCGTSAAWHCRCEPATVQRHYPALSDRDFSAGLPGDLPRPGVHRVAPF